MAESTLKLNANTTVNNIDVSEDFIESLGENILKILLQDRTQSTPKKYVPIFWATNNYKHLGMDYAYSMPIKPELITHKKNKVIQPRVVKSKKIQAARSKDMAEVFTPSWICNMQNNQIDEIWFGRANVFNTQDENHSWLSNLGKIEFPEDKSWMDYVCEERIEITCGEAPYLVSRYDTTTGNFIDVQNRIGLLDRKLRVVAENTKTKEEWLEAATLALKNTYGYEWQGDNLLLARENLLMTMMDYYREKFNEELPVETLEEFAVIISWNIWQMDGLKCTVPDSCKEDIHVENDLLLGEVVTKTICEGCSKNRIKKHNGIYCKIMDWKTGKPIKFLNTLK